MDSDFNDIGFLMENVKQEPAHEGAGPLADVENTDTIPTYMTDFILDYINRSLKNEEEETQPECNETDGANEEESVEDLIARAENMIRENTRHDEINIPETSTIATSIDWMQHMQQYISQQPETRLANNPTSSGLSTNTSPTIYLTDESGQPDVIEVPYVAPAATDNVISLDTDSDDEVIFVNSNHPPRPRTVDIPVIDLSDQASPSDHRLQSPQRSETRKRAGDILDIPDAVETTPEKEFRHSCAICLEDVKAPHSTTCGHIYCGDCIKNALKIFKKCPTCNKKLKTSNVHPIYL